MFSLSKRRTTLSLLTASIAILAAVAASMGMASGPDAGTPRPPESVPAPTIRLVQVADGFELPTDISNSGTPGDQRLFITEKKGTVRIITGTGTVLPSHFLSITAQVRSTEFERGLLGLAFHPNYDSNGYFYVNYTYVGDADEMEGDTRISRFQVDPGNPNQADPSSELVLLKIPQPYANHNAGDLAFGPDGYLYIPLGDGGSVGDPEDRAQDLSLLLGKILRVDVDSGSPYAIPVDNPYVGQAGVQEEIWASGVRNPWRLSFDRTTGDLFFGDVGQNAFEELNYQQAGSPGGENYGWRCYEGNHPFNTAGCGPITDYDPPAIEYSHGEGRAIVSGFMYRGSQFPEMNGHFLFADYVEGRIWSMFHDGSDWQVKSQGTYPGSSFSTFGEDISGEIYVADYENSAAGSGVIFRIENLPINLFLPIITKPSP